MAQPGAKIPVGTVLAGKYRVTREIGRGGMASVYEAENVDIGKRVAIKVLAQELTSSSVVVERFLREARAAAAIRSPYICDVYDSGRLEDNRPFLVLELLEGESLFERLTQIAYLDIETTLAMVMQVCRGLTKAHAANIVHRDLKPENIFLTRNEEGMLLSKILDFGLAKFYAPLTGPENKAQARLTREGAVFGTPAYMSPEQVRGQGAVDHRADLWALGCITYECLTGKTVWKTEQGVAMTFAQIASSALPDPLELRSDLPATFKPWFERALSRDLERRFQSAKDFSAALNVALAGQVPAEFERTGGQRLVPPLTPLKSEAVVPEVAVAPPSSGGPGHGRGRSFASEPTKLVNPSQLNTTTAMDVMPSFGNAPPSPVTVQARAPQPPPMPQPAASGSFGKSVPPPSPAPGSFGRSVPPPPPAPGSFGGSMAPPPAPGSFGGSMAPPPAPISFGGSMAPPAPVSYPAGPAGMQPPAISFGGSPPGPPHTHPSFPNAASGPSGPMMSQVPSLQHPSMPAQREVSAPTDSRGRRGGRGLAIAAAALLVVGGGAFMAWKYSASTTGLQPRAVGAASAGASASANARARAVAGSAAPSTTTAPADGDYPSALPWLPLVQEAQGRLASGNIKGAADLLKEAYEKGGHGVPRTMLDHVQIGVTSAASKAPCALTGLGRPRTYDLAPPPSGARQPIFGSGRPSIALGPRGPVIAWTDAHKGAERAYAALLDEALRDMGEPADVTPDGTSVARVELSAVGDKLAMAYWETRGAEAGVYVRWLDAGGQSMGPRTAVAQAKARGSAVAIEPGPDGSLFVVWTAETESESDDLFLRRLSPNLEPQGEPARLTDFMLTGARKPRVRSPSLAVLGDTLHIAFRLERDPNRQVHHLRLPIAEAGKGLEAMPGKATADRQIGEAAVVSTEKSKAEAPSIACGTDTCFMVWHAEMQGGVFAAQLDPAKVPPLWKKEGFAKGARPSVTVSPSGQAQVVWFEGGRVMTAAIGRDGVVGPASKVARVISDQPMPSITAGTKPGEWYIAWLDYEAGHLEPYAARVQCR